MNLTGKCEVKHRLRSRVFDRVIYSSGRRVSDRLIVCCLQAATGRMAALFAPEKHAGAYPRKGGLSRLHTYELTYILAPTIPDDLIEGSVERVNGIITNRGGSIVKSDIWGRRRLAYPLQEHREGIYVHLNVECAPDAPREIESQLRITDEVLRHLVVRRD